MEKISLILSSYFFHFLKKNIAFPIYVFRTYHFDSKIIVFLSIAFHSIQHFSSMINNFHLLKFQISSNNIQCFKTNILIYPVFQNKHFDPNYTWITKRGDAGVGGGEVIWFRYTVHFPTFSQTKVCWNKQNTLHTEIRIWHLGLLTMQMFIHIGLVV